MAISTAATTVAADSQQLGTDTMLHTMVSCDTTQKKDIPTS